MVDASAVVLGLLNDGEARAQLATSPLAAPHLADSEVVHAIRGLALRGEIGSEEGALAITTWARVGIQRFAVVGLLDRLWELRANLSSYDATYIALAEALGCGLLTADGRLAAAPGPRCPITVVRT